ncbi:MAG: hypothetical protein Q9199_006137 [Rusavskia elegans]
MLAAALALASAANAHMKMKIPAPYTANGLLESGPLAGDGSDFPCKMTNGQYTPPATKNTIAVGSEQQLKLLGSAIHGGGSCQIALTKDLKPTKTSKWMVIHSVEGGCPAGSTTGNLQQENPDGEGSPPIPYKIPEGINAGEYTLAWTWFNKIGAREMYMNCAPVTLTGGSKKRYVDEASFNETQELASDEIFRRDETFPDLFKANIGQAGNGCGTFETFDPIFPNPGKSVQKLGGLNEKNTGISDNCGSGSPAGSNPGSSGASPSSGAAGSSPSASAGGSETPTVTGEGSDMGSGSSSSPAGAASPAMSIVAIPPPGAPGAAQSSAAPSAMNPMATGSAMATPAVPAATGSASPSGSSSSGSTGGSGAPGSMPCSTPGQSVCSPDGMKIGTCNMNKMAVLMAVAPGTKCSNGMMVYAKRSAKFARSYGRHY